MAEREAATRAREAAGDQQRRCREPDQRADEMAQLQAAAGQQRREEHDQQRPEIMDQVGLGRRRRLDRGVVERRVAEARHRARARRRRRLA